jgi:ABC-type polar amino acid transport system ATPase subunit
MIFELKNIHMSYDKLVLKNLSIMLEGYKSIAVIGASGCGKSTLLRLIAGIEFPESGYIRINRFDVKKETRSEYQKHIGYVFQKHNLFPHLTLQENITLILEKTRGFGKEEAKAKAYGLLEMLHLCEEKDKLPRNVSGGQAQRASIARAFCTDPDIILLDEPTASLDPILTHEVLDAIKELKNIGKDFIFVTHEIGFVQSFAEYFIFMDEGEIIEHGKIDNLKKPKTKKLVDFMDKVGFHI